MFNIFHISCTCFFSVQSFHLLNYLLTSCSLLYYSTILPALFGLNFFVCSSLPVHNSGAYRLSHEEDKSQTLVDNSLAMTQIEAMLSPGWTCLVYSVFYTLNFQP